MPMKQLRHGKYELMKTIKIEPHKIMYKGYRLFYEVYILFRKFHNIYLSSDT